MGLEIRLTVSSTRPGNTGYNKFSVACRRDEYT